MTGPSGRQAIVLAAGAGLRFGGDKLTALWRGRPLIMAAVRTALAAGVDKVTVVTGADDGIAGALAPLGGARLRLISAPDWNEGLAASLRAGVRALPSPTLATVVFLGDMPLVPAFLADQLLDAVIGGAPAAVVRSPHGPAHPVAFSAGLFPELLGLRGDRGARSVLQALGDAVVAIDCEDAGAVYDVDRPEDLDYPDR